MTKLEEKQKEKFPLYQDIFEELISISENIVNEAIETFSLKNYSVQFYDKSTKIIKKDVGNYDVMLDFNEHLANIADVRISELKQLYLKAYLIHKTNLANISIQKDERELWDEFRDLEEEFKAKRSNIVQLKTKFK